MIRKYKLNLRLAPKSVRKNGNMVFSNVKDRKKISNIKNCLFDVRCENCDFQLWMKTTNLDAERTLKHQFYLKGYKIMDESKYGSRYSFQNC